MTTFAVIGFIMLVWSIEWALFEAVDNIKKRKIK